MKDLKKKKGWRCGEKIEKIIILFLMISVSIYLRDIVKTNLIWWAEKI